MFVIHPDEGTIQLTGARDLSIFSMPELEPESIAAENGWTSVRRIVLHNIDVLMQNQLQAATVVTVSTFV